MKMQKKLTLGLAGVLMSLMMFAASANAFVCSNATVIEVGPQPTWSGTASSAVKLQCEGSTNQIRYFFSSDIEDTGLATALTAFSMDKPVKAWIVSGAWNSLITDIVILPTP